MMGELVLHVLDQKQIIWLQCHRQRSFCLN